MSDTTVYVTHEYVCLTCGANFDASATGDLPDDFTLRCGCGSSDVIEQR